MIHIILRWQTNKQKCFMNLEDKLAKKIFIPNIINHVAFSAISKKIIISNSNNLKIISQKSKSNPCLAFINQINQNNFKPRNFNMINSIIKTCFKNRVFNCLIPHLEI